MRIAPLLEAHAVVDADAGEQRHLLAAQAVHPPATTAVRQLDVLRADQLAPGAEVLADEIAVRHCAQPYAQRPARSWPCHYQDRRGSCRPAHRVGHSAAWLPH